MLRVKTYVAASPIHGLGLFAVDPIPCGTVVWTYDLRVDYVVNEPPQGRLSDWAWREEDGWVVPGDDAKYMNHSFTPSINGGTSRHDPDVAARDITTGEELTIDYSTFDLDWPEWASEHLGHE